MGHGAPVGPVCLFKMTCEFGVAAPARGGVCRRRHLGAAGARGEPSAHQPVVSEAGEEAAVPDSNRGQPTGRRPPGTGQVQVQVQGRCLLLGEQRAPVRFHLLQTLD